jgi:Kae1-associated kinase Bud32
LKPIRRGAEAEIFKSEWLDRQIVLKRRVPKKYRNEELDKKLREARTKLEVKLITEARALGLSTPIVFDVDTEESQITMEYIDGERVKDVLPTFGEKERVELCKRIGGYVGTLHKNDIIHGDLTTSNMILKDDRIYFIDFSLGEKSAEIESKGVDLHLLMEAFESTHSELIDSFDHVLEGYKNEYEDATKVIKKVKEIEKRGRYT